MKKIMSANEWINYTALFDLPMIIVFSDRDQEIMFKWHFRFLVSLYKKRRCGLLFYHGIESLALSLGLVLTDIRSVGSLLMPCIWRTKSLAIGGSQGRILKGLE